MGVNSLPKTVTRQHRDCDLNPGRSALESSTLTTQLPSHQILITCPFLCVVTVTRDHLVFTVCSGKRLY